jgi:ABC-type dipeptide/oligopeptide/nickel transport system ATPase component
VLRDVVAAPGARRRARPVGESGCGKTTLGLAILGLLPEEARVGGTIPFEGEDLLRCRLGGSGGCSATALDGAAIVDELASTPSTGSATR